MADQRAKVERFKALTAIDLQEWAGTTIFYRGQEYQRGRRVQGLARTPGGSVVAWVMGSQRYATSVDLVEGALTSSCSCPYGMTCKHAVALALEYIEQLNKRNSVPTVTEQDQRLAVIGVAEGDEGDEDWDEDEDLDEDDAGSPARPAGAAIGSLRSFLEQQPQARLVEMLEELAGSYPDVRDSLEYRRNLATGRLPELISAVRREIAAASAEPGWRNDWNDEGYTPDYSRVRDYLAALLAEGHADAVVDLGAEVLEAGRSQIEMSHDEGQTFGEIIECLEIVFQALAQSTRPAVERMLWVINAVSSDDYDLTEGSTIFWEQEFAEEDWNAVADELARRLEAEAPGANDNYYSTYRRDRLSNWLIEALGQAGREDEIIPLAEREAERTHSYVRLVGLLRQAGRTAEAEQWIYRGIAATQKQWPGIASQLRDSLRELRQSADDRPFVAALQAEEFFREGPSAQAFQALRQAAEHAEVWPAVRAAAMLYLETGARPPAAYNQPPWPLPEINLPADPAPRARNFPLVDVLIGIAITEEQPDQVLRWYDQPKTAWRGWGGVSEDQIAEAVSGAYPERALAIWRKLAEAQIATTQPRAYELAVAYLRKLYRLQEKQGRLEDWRRYVAELRQANARKRRLVEMLDGIVRMRH